MQENSLKINELNSIYTSKGVELLTIEGRILLHLLMNGQSRIKELMLASGSSYRGFYLALDRLKEKRLVHSEIDCSDRRAQIIRLV